MRPRFFVFPLAISREHDSRFFMGLQSPADDGFEGSGYAEELVRFNRHRLGIAVLRCRVPLAFAGLLALGAVCLKLAPGTAPIPPVQSQDRLSKQRVCSTLEASQAEREADELEDWNSVYLSFKRFGHCDEGTISEKYSASVSRLLIHDWNNLDALLRLAASDKDFEQFVIRHIDETMSEDEAAQVIDNARLHCPAEAQWLCKSIVDY